MGKFCNVALVVSSCDDYKVLIKPFFEVFFERFNEFDGNCYTTASGNFECNHQIVKGIDCQYKDLSFSTRLKKLLKQVNEEYILFFLDDFFILNKVNANFVLSGLSLLTKNKRIAAVQLKDCLSSTDICTKKLNDYFSIRSNKTPYICTTQVTIWRKSMLIKCLRDGESPWDFEIIGSYRLRSTKKIICYRNDEASSFLTYPIAGIIHRGHVVKEFDAFREYDFYNSIKSYDFAKHINAKKENKIKKVPVVFGHHISFKNLLNFIYPFVSKVFPFAHRFGVGYPNYVSKYLKFNKLKKEHRRNY